MLQSNSARPHLGPVLRQYELVDRVNAYDPTPMRRCSTAPMSSRCRAHGTQKRAWGDPYFSHPIEVAGIMTDLQLDDETIATAILHDTVEDTVATIEEIETSCSAPTSRGWSTASPSFRKIEAQTENERAAENLRKFLLAMSRRHPRAAGQARRPAAQHAHAPLHQERGQAPPHRARDDGHLCPARRADRHVRVHEARCRRSRSSSSSPKPMQSITKRLEQLTGGRRRPHRARSDRASSCCCRATGSRPKSSGREKHPYSIWKKMAERHISFEQLSDIMAFRVIVPSERGLLPRARRDPPALADGAGAVQGLYLDAEAQRLSLAPHHA